MGHTRTKHNPSNNKLVNVPFTERRNRTRVTLPLERIWRKKNEVESKPGKQKLRKAAAETHDRKESIQKLSLLATDPCLPIPLILFSLSQF